MAERTLTSLTADPRSWTSSYSEPFTTTRLGWTRGSEYGSILSRPYEPYVTARFNMPAFSQTMAAQLLGAGSGERAQASSVETEVAYREVSLLQQRQDFLVGLLGPEILSARLESMFAKLTTTEWSLVLRAPEAQSLEQYALFFWALDRLYKLFLSLQGVDYFVARWLRGVEPQYDPGHELRVLSITKASPENLKLEGVAAGLKAVGDALSLGKQYQEIRTTGAKVREAKAAARKAELEVEAAERAARLARASEEEELKVALARKRAEARLAEQEGAAAVRKSELEVEAAERAARLAGRTEEEEAKLIIAKKQAEIRTAEQQAEEAELRLRKLRREDFSETLTLLEKYIPILEKLPPALRQDVEAELARNVSMLQEAPFEMDVYHQLPAAPAGSDE